LIADAPPGAAQVADPPRMRAEYEAATATLAGPLEPVADVRDVDGTRIITPADHHGVVLLLHGGGWVVGSPDTHEQLGRMLANRAGARVVLPAYRLAPEHPHPAPLEDSEAALALARELAGDQPIAVAGDSAGGQLAAVLARRHHDLALQALIYPVLDAGMATGSYRRYGVGYPLGAADMAWYLQQLAGDADDPDVSPLRAPDLAGLPPAAILLASHDVLRDEGEAYADRLARAGVAVQLRVIDGTVHGFVRWVARLDLAVEALDWLGAQLRVALQRGDD
jgi:acetyl esterase